MWSPPAPVSRQRRLGKTQDFVETPERVEAEHHHQAGHQQQKRVVEEPLAQRSSLVARMRCRHHATSGHGCTPRVCTWNTSDRRRADMTAVIRPSGLAFSFGDEGGVWTAMWTY